MSGLSDQIELLFQARGYLWKFGDVLRTPTAGEIEEVLTLAKNSLEFTEGNEAQLEIGRLIIRKADGHYDVYVHFGDLNEQ